MALAWTKAATSKDGHAEILKGWAVRGRPRYHCAGEPTRGPLEAPNPPGRSGEAGLRELRHTPLIRLLGPAPQMRIVIQNQIAYKHLQADSVHLLLHHKLKFRMCTYLTVPVRA